MFLIKTGLCRELLLFIDCFCKNLLPFTGFREDLNSAEQIVMVYWSEYVSLASDHDSIRQV